MNLKRKGLTITPFNELLFGFGLPIDAKELIELLCEPSSVPAEVELRVTGKFMPDERTRGRGRPEGKGDEQK